MVINFNFSVRWSPICDLHSAVWLDGCTEHPRRSERLNSSHTHASLVDWERTDHDLWILKEAKNIPQRNCDFWRSSRKRVIGECCFLMVVIVVQGRPSVRPSSVHRVMQLYVRSSEQNGKSKDVHCTTTFRFL